MSLSINKSNRILIAGSKGMVGSAIYRKFQKKIKEFNNQSVLFAPSREELDFSIYSQVENWFKHNRPNIVIIAAAKVGGIYANKTYPFQFILENLKIQTNLIELSKNYGVENLLFLGSSCIYPKFASQPIKEEDLLTGSLEKTNEFYALAKIAGIKLCEALNIQYGLNYLCLMPTNLYGPGDNYHSLNSHVLPALIRRISEAKDKKLSSITCWGTGTPLREFLYVEDLADACLFVMEKWEKKFRDSIKDNCGNSLYLLNVGSNYEISIKDLAYKIAVLIDYKGEIIWDKNKPDGTPRKILDSSRLRDLGWAAKTDLHKGIELTIQSYRKEIENESIRR